MRNSVAYQDRREELDLLQGILKNDARSGRLFFHRYNWTIETSVRYIFKRKKRLLTEDDVRDMVGDIWVTLLENDKRPLRRFDPSRHIRIGTWLGMLARHKAIDHLRTFHDIAISLFEIEGQPETPISSHTVEDLEAKEHLALAYRALRELKQKDRRFLEAWYYYKLTPEEMAEKFNIAVATVYSRRFKIQEKLSQKVRRLGRLARVHHPFSASH
jgi:RNA polymerase sigma-70 factor, ECF subfamily